MKLSKKNSKPLVIRIGSYPTIQRPGQGLAVSKLMAIEKFETKLISYKNNEDYILDHKVESKVFFFKFPNPTMPKSRKGLIFYLLQVKRLWAILYFSYKAIRVISIKRPDILHVHSPLHFLIIQWARHKDIETFLTFHGTDFLRIKGSLIYRFLLIGIQNICCVSGLNRDELINIFPHASINLVSNGVDADEFSTTFDYNIDNTVVAVGTLRWHKGFDKLIIMFSSIVKIHPEWVLKIIGDGPDKELLQQLITSLDLQRNVVLMGAMGRDKLTRELSRAKIFALSSVTEGLPKVLLEAMCAKSACVSFDVGDCARVLGNCGLLIKPDDSDSFIQAIISLINDTSMQRQLSVFAESRAKEFSWNKYLDLHQTLYQQALLNRK